MLICVAYWILGCVLLYLIYCCFVFLFLVSFHFFLAFISDTGLVKWKISYTLRPPWYFSILMWRGFQRYFWLSICKIRGSDRFKNDIIWSELTDVTQVEMCNWRGIYCALGCSLRGFIEIFIKLSRWGYRREKIITIYISLSLSHTHTL